MHPKNQGIWRPNLQGLGLDFIAQIVFTILNMVSLTNFYSRLCSLDDVERLAVGGVHFIGSEAHTFIQPQGTAGILCIHA